MDWKPLLEAARNVRELAYCPYSQFQVGAAIQTEDGSVFTGCNVENRTFGLTVCAERVAVHTAIAAGHRKVVAVAVVTDTHPPAAPCGQCREVLAEFGSPDLPLAMGNLEGETVEVTLADLLPYPFELPGG